MFNLVLFSNKRIQIRQAKKHAYKKKLKIFSQQTDQLNRALRYRFGVNFFSVDVHVKCGYLTYAFSFGHIPNLIDIDRDETK